MKKLLILTIAITLSNFSFSQDQPYNPNANAQADIQALIAKASKEKKFILIQAGGNWCSWCLEFYRLTKEDKQLDSAINKNFLLYHLNYSKENKNLPIFKKYQFPQRFGFPVFIVLDMDGNLLHIQNSEYLENGKKSYDIKKVLDFLENWTPQALDPSKY